MLSLLEDVMYALKQLGDFGGAWTGIDAGSGAEADSEECEGACGGMEADGFGLFEGPTHGVGKGVEMEFG